MRLHLWMAVSLVAAVMVEFLFLEDSLPTYQTARTWMAAAALPPGYEPSRYPRRHRLHRREQSVIRQVESCGHLLYLGIVSSLAKQVYSHVDPV